MTVNNLKGLWRSLHQQNRDFQPSLSLCSAIAIALNYSSLQV
ncbi:hypothetical protein [Nostoc sp.]